MNSGEDVQFMSAVSNNSHMSRGNLRVLPLLPGYEEILRSVTECSRKSPATSMYQQQQWRSRDTEIHLVVAT